MKTSTKSPSYIIRNAYSYCFRMNVPRDLQGIVGKKELRYSLKTGYLGVAKHKARYLAGQVQSIFRLLRKGILIMANLSDDQIKELVTRYIKQSLKRINNLFIDEPGDDVPPYTNEPEFYSYLSELDGIRQDLIADLNMGNWGVLENAIGDFLKKQGIKDVDKTSMGYRKICADIFQAEIKLLPIEKRHRQNDFSYKDELPDIFPDVFDKLPKQGEPTPMPPEESSEPLDKVVGDYWYEKEPTWKERTKPEIRRALDHMINFVGKDTQIHNIDAKIMRDYKQHLITEKIRSGKTRSIKTINDKYLCFTKAFFNFAKSNQYIKENPAEGMLIKDRKKKRPHEQQDPFSKSDLKMLFCYSSEYGEDKHKKPQNFWIPLIGLFTGMREEEISQLYITDLIKIDGLWCLDIKEEEDKPDKSVKASAKRIVPLHPFLIDDLNFIGFVKNRPDQSGRIFPEMRRVNGRYSHGFCQWFGKFKIRCGVDPTPRKKTFHSFRHTVVDNLMQKEIPERAVSMLVGHAISGQTGGRYAKPFKPKKLMERTVLQLDFGIDLSHLKQSKFVPKK